MRHYFFLSNALSELEFTSKLPLSFADLLTLFDANMSKEDRARVDQLRLYFDLQNVLAHLQKDRHDFRGVLSANELEDALTTEVYFPDYLFAHFVTYPDKEEAIRAFFEVMEAYFETDSPHIRFEKELRVVLEALRLERHSQKSTREIPEGFEVLQERLKECDGIPQREEEVIAQYRFEHYAQANQAHPFSIEHLLDYMMQLMILEDIEMRRAEAGQEVVKTLLRESA